MIYGIKVKYNIPNHEIIGQIWEEFYATEEDPVQEAVEIINYWNKTLRWNEDLRELLQVVIISESHEDQYSPEFKDYLAKFKFWYRIQHDEKFKEEFMKATDESVRETFKAFKGLQHHTSAEKTAIKQKIANMTGGILEYRFIQNIWDKFDEFFGVDRSTALDWMTADPGPTESVEFYVAEYGDKFYNIIVNAAQKHFKPDIPDKYQFDIDYEIPEGAKVPDRPGASPQKETGNLGDLFD